MLTLLLWYYFNIHFVCASVSILTEKKTKTFSQVHYMNHLSSASAGTKIDVYVVMQRVLLKIASH